MAPVASEPPSCVCSNRRADERTGWPTGEERNIITAAIDARSAATAGARCHGDDVELYGRRRGGVGAVLWSQKYYPGWLRRVGLPPFLPRRCLLLFATTNSTGEISGWTRTHRKLDSSSSSLIWKREIRRRTSERGETQRWLTDRIVPRKQNAHPPVLAGGAAPNKAFNHIALFHLSASQSVGPSVFV